MTPKLYMTLKSPPVRSVLMTAKALNLNLELIEVNLQKGEHLTPEYLKMNPQHTVPTLVDDGCVIWDSHAIMVYLVSKYGKDDSLYPKDFKKRAVVDQRLHFESGVIFARLCQIVTPFIRYGKKTIDQFDKDAIIEAYGFLEAFLEGKQWIAGDSITIADFSLITSVASMNVIIPIEKEKFPRLISWLKKAESFPLYEANKKGLEDFAALMSSFSA